MILVGVPPKFMSSMPNEYEILLQSVCYTSVNYAHLSGYLFIKIFCSANYSPSPTEKQSRRVKYTKLAPPSSCKRSWSSGMPSSLCSSSIKFAHCILNLLKSTYSECLILQRFLQEVVLTMFPI